MDMSRVRCVLQRFAEFAVAEHLREFGQQLQVGFIGLLGHQQHEQHAHRPTVGRVELNGGCQAQEGAGGILEALDATVGDGDALPQSGRTQAFAGEQAVEDRAAGDALVVLEQQSCLFEDALLAARVEVDHHVGQWQELGYEAHSLVDSRNAPCAGATQGRQTVRGAWRSRRENARIIPTPRTRGCNEGVRLPGPGA